MKLAKTEETPALRSAHATQVATGDTLTTSVTHEIAINGDKAWVKFEAATSVGQHEDGEEAKERIIAYVSNAVLDAVKAAVNTVNGVK